MPVTDKSFSKKQWQSAHAGHPAVFVRGEQPPILSAATFAEMALAFPSARVVTVAATGHAPTLEEREVGAATDAMRAWTV